MRSTIEAEIQALRRAFVEDLSKLVRQHTLELVLAQLEGGASGGARARPRSQRRAKVEPEVEITPVHRRARRRSAKLVEPGPTTVDRAPELAAPVPAQEQPDPAPEVPHQHAWVVPVAATA